MLFLFLCLNKIISLSLSLYIVDVFSRFHRYLAICRPFLNVSTAASRRVVYGSYLLAILFASPMLKFAHSMYKDSTSHHCSFRYEIMSTKIYHGCLLILFIVSIIVVFVLYTLIYATFLKHFRKIRAVTARVTSSDSTSAGEL